MLSEIFSQMSDAELNALAARIETLPNDALEQVFGNQPMPAPSSPVMLGKIAWGDNWWTPPHVARIDQALVDVMYGNIKRLLVTVPPRHAKSTMCSEFFPATYLGNFPDNRVMLASYQAEFAAVWGGKARALLNQFGQLYFGVSVATSPAAIDNWQIHGRKGGMVTAGVGGALTGRGANLLIIDDPTKNSEDANSFIMREKAWDWYRSVAYTRLEPNAAIVLIQTRWHDDDLAGRVLKDSKENGEEWVHLDFPALALESDILGRNPGEALWPARYNQEALEKIRGIVGDYIFEALFQQRPPTRAGAIFNPDWFRYYDRHSGYYRLFDQNKEPLGVIHDKECERFIIVDCAATSEEEARTRKGKPPSDSVISTCDWHAKTGRLMLLDCEWGRWSFPDLLVHVHRKHRRWSPSWIGIENEKTGKAALQTLTGLPVRPIEHEGKDKLARSSRCQNQMQQGKVFFDRTAPWRRTVERQLREWTGMQDEKIDIGDTLFYACLHAGDFAPKTLQLPGFFFKHDRILGGSFN